MIESDYILNSKITQLFLEFVDRNHKEDFSEETFEIIIGLKKANTLRFLRFIADNNVVEIKEETLPNILQNNVFDLIDFSSDEDFNSYMCKTISKIEVEKYSDDQANGFRITLENNLQIEVYPNAYGTSGYFKNVKKYFPKKIKYLADQTYFENL